MRVIVITMALLFGIPSFASETVHFMAGMSFIKCVKSNKGVNCTSPAAIARPIQLSLTTGPNDTVPSGQYNFTDEIDGYSIQGSIYVMKLSNQPADYFIQPNIAAIKGNDVNTFTVQTLGAISVGDFSKLNDILFNGQWITNGNISFQPIIEIGATGSNLSKFTKLATSARLTSP